MKLFQRIKVQTKRYLKNSLKPNHIDSVFLYIVILKQVKMKKIILVSFALIIGLHGIAQKKKTVKKVTPKNELVTTYQNLSAELITIKTKRSFVLFVKEYNQVKDTLVLIESIDKSFMPSNCSIKSFNVRSKSLILVEWDAQTINTSKDKNETIQIKEHQVWNLASKKQLFVNSFKKTHTKENVFLDKNKTASHEVEKNRTEGAQFTLLTNGDITLYSKTQQSHFTYNQEEDLYKSVDVSKPKPSKKKK